MEDNTENNEEFAKKLREETEKHDMFLDEIVGVKETFRLTKLQFEETQAKIEEQDKELAQLKDTIDEKQEKVNKALKQVEADRKINIFEEEKNRKYSKANAALRAKLDFIESKYDYTSSAKTLSIEDFKELMESNVKVNGTLENFNLKLGDVQKEIQQLEVLKKMA